ncbi:hypothetical protein BSLA_02f4484 [Burkholderia stabilis]|nr:hypothetical protein BSLA_02f4484 [Burkholderia stabilis]
MAPARRALFAGAEHPQAIADDGVVRDVFAAGRCCVQAGWSSLPQRIAASGVPTAADARPRT